MNVYFKQDYGKTLNEVLHIYFSISITKASFLNDSPVYFSALLALEPPPQTTPIKPPTMSIFQRSYKV